MRLMEILQEQINSFYGIAFEEVVEEFLIEVNKLEKFYVKFSKIGKWWHKGEEIDIVTLNEESKEITFLECKWSTVNEKEAEHIIANLKRKAMQVKWYNAERKEHYGVIAKTIKGKERLRKKGYISLDLSDFEELLRVTSSPV